LHEYILFHLNGYVNFAVALRSIGIDDPEMANVIYMLVATALTIVAALLSWNLLEKPFLSLKKYFPYDKPKIVKMEPSIASVSNL
jgi:peptidoglycan/LPS O-acetylase OafA/YrhL